MSDLLKTYRLIVDGKPTQEFRAFPDFDPPNPQVDMDQVYTIASTKNNRMWHPTEKFSDRYDWAHQRLQEIGYNFDSTEARAEFLYALTEWQHKDALDKALGIISKHFNFEFLIDNGHLVKELHDDRLNPDGVCWASWEDIRTARGYGRMTKAHTKDEERYMAGEINDFSAWVYNEFVWISCHAIDPVTLAASEENTDSIGGTHQDDIVESIRSNFGVGIYEIVDVTGRGHRCEPFRTYRLVKDGDVTHEYGVWKYGKEYLITEHEIDPITGVASWINEGASLIVYGIKDILIDIADFFSVDQNALVKVG